MHLRAFCLAFEYVMWGSIMFDLKQDCSFVSAVPFNIFYVFLFHTIPMWPLFMAKNVTIGWSTSVLNNYMLVCSDLKVHILLMITPMTHLSEMFVNFTTKWTAPFVISFMVGQRPRIPTSHTLSLCIYNRSLCSCWFAETEANTPRCNVFDKKMSGLILWWDHSPAQTDVVCESKPSWISNGISHLEQQQHALAADRE